MPRETASSCYIRLRAEAELLAGSPTDLAQRATVYHHLYADSAGNHTFPLLAAHGALWARGYFAVGMNLGRLLSLRFTNGRAARLRQLANFANAFREINRLVCVETYVAYHLTRQFGRDPFLASVLPEQLCRHLNHCHEAVLAGRSLAAAERRAMFEACFLWEQEFIVSPGVERALEVFNWTEIRWLALRPRIAFAYIPRLRQFRFRNFASRAERIERGLQAFDLAEDVGWTATEAALKCYHVLPAAVFQDASGNFARMRSSLFASNRRSGLVEA